MIIFLLGRTKNPTNRNKQTINNIILENIEFGTIIVTDCWSGYVDLTKLGYFHLTVNHSESFIDPLTGANTQSIENRWSVYKKKFKSRYINNPSDFSLLFAEFSFKLKFKDQSFSYFMQNLNKFD
ncbi:hypothetical protein H312_00052 [Anncaliia algerae PRA339]|uniref:ISXO2-like transposase domain-containing protein n=1 Tax=Anncaliia algerae PRA339 TaxID=1288291 RepID=A0A059F5V7_9MICR|nr:hypothetical protein H312_00052 [Anncaliia algerae PRA339]